MTELPPNDPHHAEPEKIDPQTSILEALDMSDVLARLERRPRAHVDAEADQEPSEEEAAAWLEELRDLATQP